MSGPDLSGPTLILDRDPRAVRFARRLITIPIIVALMVIAIALCPLWIPVAWLIDRTSSQPRCTLRCGIFFLHYLGCELAGLAAVSWLTLLGAARAELQTEADANRLFRLQCWWGSKLLLGGARIFGFDIQATGEQAIEGGPMILLVRHASTADTVLASEFVSNRHGIRLRYVLKRELLWDPCLDIVGNRTTHFFVNRGSDAPQQEIDGIRRLLEGLDRTRGGPGVVPGDGILIYPEGTRFSVEKRERALERLRGAGNTRLHDRAKRLTCTLPPRLGGPLALLEGNPGLDVVICSHFGFDRAASFWDLWNGALLGSTVRVHFKRISYDAIPKQRDAIVDWLYDEWEEVDRWVGERSHSATKSSASAE